MISEQCTDEELVWFLKQEEQRIPKDASNVNLKPWMFKRMIQIIGRLAG